MIIDINKIVENAYNINKMSDLKFKALVHSLKEVGSNRLFPLEVLPEKDGKYVLIDGKHRWTALKELGIKEAYIEISDLKNGYEKLRTISKNSVHGESDQLNEAQLIADIKKHGISDSEIMASIGIDEKELITIDNLTNFDLSDFEGGDEIDLDNIGEQEVPEIKKDITLHLSEVHYEFLNNLEEFTGLKDISESIILVSKYFQLLQNNNGIEDDAYEIAKEFVSQGSNIDFDF